MALAQTDSDLRRQNQPFQTRIIYAEVLDGLFSPDLTGGISPRRRVWRFLADISTAWPAQSEELQRVPLYPKVFLRSYSRFLDRQMFANIDLTDRVAVDTDQVMVLAGTDRLKSFLPFA